MDTTLTSDQILAKARAFMESRVLLTAAELDLFTLLEQPTEAGELAERKGWHVRPLVILLDALAALGFLEKNGEAYRTPPELFPTLSSRSPESIRPMLLHNVGLWTTWSALTSIVAETGRTQRTPVTHRDLEELEAFIGAMDVVGRRLAGGIVASIDLTGVGTVLDVGGASGTYSLAFLKSDPNLTVTIFDLPAVIRIAQARIAEEGLGDRVRFQAGDFSKDALPGGHDLGLLSAIIHQNSLEQNLDLYRKVFEALNPGGRIVIRDHIMEPDRTRPPAGAMFAVNMLVGTQGGSTYTFQEVRTGLQQAGFTDVRLLQKGVRMDGLVQGTKPPQD